jgi:hypothetical protein
MTFYLLMQIKCAGELYHPPVTQNEFLRAVAALNNYLAAPITRDAVTGYPQQFDSAEIDADIRAEIVVPEKSSADELDQNYPLDDLKNIE